MKNLLKKFVAVIASFALVLTLVIGAVYADTTTPTGTITINAKDGQTLDGKTFKVYQLMTATGSENNFSYTINGEYLDAMKTATGASDQDGILAYLENEDLTPAAKRGFAEAMREAVKSKHAHLEVTASGTSEQITVPYGYYLVVENNATTGATSLCMLNSVTPTSTVTIKSDFPDVVKKVKEDVSYTADEGWGAGYNDVADYDIGDAVPFRLYSTVPDTTGYETYTMTFHDKMSTGLTFDSDSVVVTLGETTLTKGKDYSVVTSPVDGCTFEVKLNDVAGEDGKKIIVSYSATLNTNAIVGYNGNPNAVKLEYSSNPYNSTETNETKWDNVVVFTFNTTVNKVDKDGNKLAGAKFELYASDEKTKINLQDLGNGVNEVSSNGNAVITSDTINNIVIKGLDSGTYYLKEIEAPAGYDLLTDFIEININATYAEDRQNWVTETENPIINVSDEQARTILSTYGYTFDNELKDSQIIDVDGTTLKVINYTHGTLPETGGSGIYMYLTVGGILLAVAVVYFVKTKKEEC